MNVQNALSFPFKDSNWLIKLLIGGALTLVTLLPMACALLIGENRVIQVVTYLLFIGLLVAFLGPLGYSFSILKAAQQGDAPTLPEWKDWKSLGLDGLKVFGICLAYGIVVAVLNYLVARIMSNIPVIGPILSLLKIVVGVLFLLAGPFIGIALCKVAQSGKIADGFKVNEILAELKSKAAEYITVSLILIGIMQIIKIALGLDLYSYMIIARMFWRSAVTFPLVGLLTPFVMFWILIVSARMWGEIYGKKS